VNLARRTEADDATEGDPLPPPIRTAVWTVLFVALLCALYVAAYRVHVESQTRRVELVMDYPDFSALARSYGYNELQFLIALRRAGLTSLAVPEELGSGINL